jgi:hypothetical protein
MYTNVCLFSDCQHGCAQCTFNKYLGIVTGQCSGLVAEALACTYNTVCAYVKMYKHYTRTASS